MLPVEIPVHVGNGIKMWKTGRVTKCAGCPATIVWCKTHQDMKAPVNVQPDGSGDYTSHFATCPQGSRFRKKKGGS